MGDVNAREVIAVNREDGTVVLSDGSCTVVSDWIGKDGRRLTCGRTAFACIAPLGGEWVAIDLGKFEAARTQ